MLASTELLVLHQLAARAEPIQVVAVVAEQVAQAVVEQAVVVARVLWLSVISVHSAAQVARSLALVDILYTPLSVAEHT
jgi:propanediol dehydratase large subunit